MTHVHSHSKLLLSEIITKITMFTFILRTIIQCQRRPWWTPPHPPHLPAPRHLIYHHHLQIENQAPHRHHRQIRLWKIRLLLLIRCWGELRPPREHPENTSSSDNIACFCCLYTIIKHRILFRSCISYILVPEFPTTGYQLETMSLEELQNFPLVRMVNCIQYM
jgi:hypothetical protein